MQNTSKQIRLEVFFCIKMKLKYSQFIGELIAKAIFFYLFIFQLLLQKGLLSTYVSAVTRQFLI